METNHKFEEITPFYLIIFMHLSTYIVISFMEMSMFVLGHTKMRSPGISPVLYWQSTRSTHLSY